MSNFSYATFFDRLQDLKRLQIKAEDILWTERHRDPDRTYDTVLYLGCNILRTPHIARQVTQVFTHLGVDFVAVGGAQFCCGYFPYRRSLRHGPVAPQSSTPNETSPMLSCDFWQLEFPCEVVPGHGRTAV